MTEYCEFESIDLVSYRSLHTVIRVGKQVLPIWRIIPGMSSPLMLGNNNKDLHAEDPDTQRKVNTRAGEPANFLAAPALAPAPAPDFFFKLLRDFCPKRLRLLVFFFERLRLQKKTAPAPDYWLNILIPAN